jgi:hypothetical protein
MFASDRLASMMATLDGMARKDRPGSSSRSTTRSGCSERPLRHERGEPIHGQPGVARVAYAHHAGHIAGLVVGLAEGRTDRLPGRIVREVGADDERSLRLLVDRQRPLPVCGSTCGAAILPPPV